MSFANKHDDVATAAHRHDGHHQHDDGIVDDVLEHDHIDSGGDDHDRVGEHHDDGAPAADHHDHRTAAADHHDHGAPAADHHDHRTAAADHHHHGAPAPDHHDHRPPAPDHHDHRRPAHDQHDHRPPAADHRPRPRPPPPQPRRPHRGRCRRDAPRAQLHEHGVSVRPAAADSEPGQPADERVCHQLGGDRRQRHGRLLQRRFGRQPAAHLDPLPRRRSIPP